MRIESISCGWVNQLLLGQVYSTIIMFLDLNHSHSLVFHSKFPACLGPKYPELNHQWNSCMVKIVYRHQWLLETPAAFISIGRGLLDQPGSLLVIAILPTIYSIPWALNFDHKGSSVTSTHEFSEKFLALSTLLVYSCTVEPPQELGERQ